MSGHVPKFGGGGGNFTEVFTLARTGAGKTGSGGSGSLADSAAEDSPRAGGPPSRGNRAAPRRVTGVGERDVPEPQRRAPSSEESRGSRSGGRGTSARRGASRNVNEEYAAASHLPKFGDWNTADAGDANYTVMFTAASREKQGGPAMGDGLGNKNSSGGSGDVGHRSHRNGKPKPSPSWWCFS